MSAVQALKAARGAGVRVRIDGDALTLGADAAPPSAVLDLLSRHKAGVVALLRKGSDGWSGEDWRTFFDERAGIAEFDGGLPRHKAEARAFACCVAEWLNRNPMRSPPGRCVGCGGSGTRRRQAAAARRRTDRPCLASFALLARLARRAEGRGRLRSRAIVRPMRSQMISKEMQRTTGRLPDPDRRLGDEGRLEAWPSGFRTAKDLAPANRRCRL